MKYEHVIWDWNGTLLDDVVLGHRLLNHLQRHKGVPLSSFEEYRRIFTFPITEFYKRAGLFESMESFKALAEIYICEYEKRISGCSLHDGVEDALFLLVENGITCSILTASVESMAKDQLRYYGIDKYFIAVTGKDDFYASGKEELIEKHLAKIGYSAEEIVFVGDTLHDIEIANQIGCDHILVENGHQELSLQNETIVDMVSDAMMAVNAIIGKNKERTV